MQLSAHFTLAEFTHSQEASRRGIKNDPSPTILKRLYGTAGQMEAVRSLLGDVPIIVSSGYRSPKVNALVGGAPSSHHTKGWAVDFTAPAFGDPRAIVQRLASSRLPFDQLIYEYAAWVHISFARSLRREVLTIDKRGVRAFAP